MFNIGEKVLSRQFGEGKIFESDLNNVKVRFAKDWYNYGQNGKFVGLLNFDEITLIKKEKEQVKFKEGDKVRLKKEWYKEGDYQKMHRNDRQRIGKHHSFTMKVFDEGCAKYKENVHVYVDGGVICVPKVCLELVEEPKSPMHQWTQAEIDECNRIVGDIMSDFSTTPNKKLTIDATTYLKDKTIKARLENGKVHESKPIPTDTPNPSIGMCVALCKATGREIPKFIKGDRK